MTRIVVVACACHKLVTLRRQRSRGPFLAWGAVCDFCGRGIDLRVEKRPANEPSRGRAAQ